jgi:choline dehydrogenase
MHHYIVVGAGSAGCVVAGRLAKAGHTVLLLEAGGPETEFLKHSEFSGEIVSQHSTEYLWGAGNSSDATRQFPFIGGRVAGGGSAVNGMMFVWGSNSFYRLWERTTGDPQWGPVNAARIYPQLLKYMSTRPGAMNLNLAQQFSRIFSTLTQLPEVTNYNNPSTPVGSSPYTQLFQFSNGLRCSAWDAFIGKSARIITPEQVGCSSSSHSDACESSNLEVILRATVDRIDFCNGEACGVHAIVNGKSHFFRGREIILCAGWNSPFILSRSGYGPQRVLSKCAIPLLRDLPQMGANLRNQLLLNVVGLYPQVPPGGKLSKQTNDPRGLYSGIGFIPDQLGRRKFQFLGIEVPDGFAIGVVPLQSRSTGTAQILSKDPLQSAQYTFNYLTHPTDIAELVEMAQLANQILLDMGFTPVVSEWTRETVLAQYDQTYHWVGGCSMDTLTIPGVVDTQCRVHGTKNVYVADASVIPQQQFSNQPDGNTEGGGALLVGWVISDYLLSRREC